MRVDGDLVHVAGQEFTAAMNGFASYIDGTVGNDIAAAIVSLCVQLAIDV